MSANAIFTFKRIYRGKGATVILDGSGTAAAADLLARLAQGERP